jgi:hypothetical protein
MTLYTAAFSNGFKSRSSRKIAATHGWHASGKLRSGKPWSLSGFSTNGALGARMGMESALKTTVPKGSKTNFSEVVAVQFVGETVPA